MNFDPVELFAWYGVFLFSTTLHEAAHAWVAMRCGDLTAYNGGQVSLDPTPHIRRSPVGMVILPIISLFIIHWPFGYASAPYDPVWAARHHKKAALMAMAGPVSNLLMVFTAIILLRTGIIAGLLYPPELLTSIHLADPVKDGKLIQAAILLVSIFFTMNLVLTVLNLIPLPPLDGSQIITIFLTPSQAESYRSVLNNPMMGMIGLIVAWRFFPILFNVIFNIAIHILYPGSQYS